MADNLVYEESLNTEVDQSEFISKKWVYVNDNNSQNYTSQVVIDSTPLSNAGGWISWSEGYILMPLVVQLTGSFTDTATPPVTTPLPGVNSPQADYCWAFKSGFWQMINSMTVEFNNQNVVQQTPFLNVFRSFKANTSWSLDDLKNEGSSTGYYPDSANTWSYCNDFSASTYSNARGINYPYTNNANGFSDASLATIVAGGTAQTQAEFFTASATPSFPITSVAGIPTKVTPSTATTSTVLYSGAGSENPLNAAGINQGMLQRQQWVNYYQNNANAVASLGQNIINPFNSCKQVYRSGLVQSLAGSYAWVVYAKLRLKDLADYFEQMPLLKGATMRFYINTNQTEINFTVTGAVVSTTSNTPNPYAVLNITSAPTVIGGLTCPLMIASAGLGQGSSSLPAGNYTLTLSIVRNTFQSQSGSNPVSAALTSCRLYAPVYTMNPLAESKYLSLAPTKKIMYKDIFQYQFTTPTSGPFNFLVSNGISNIVSVLVVPFISTSTVFTNSAGNTAATIPYSSYLSPLSSSPATPDPIMITNFNILVSGVNLFLNNENYDFEAFKQQLAQSNQLNGGLTTGLASGLVSEDDFTNLYRYYYGDCSRILPSEQGVSRSVQIVGQIASTVPASFMVFVEFMKEITIDISTGARIE
jgi:hypothetical protein